VLLAVFFVFLAFLALLLLLFFSFSSFFPFLQLPIKSSISRCCPVFAYLGQLFLMKLWVDPLPPPYLRAHADDPHLVFCGQSEAAKFQNIDCYSYKMRSY